MADELSIARAKAGFAEAVRRAESGETIVLTRHGRPVARLGPADPRPAASVPGTSEVREASASYEASDGHPPPPGTVSRKYRREALERLFEEEIWPRIPRDQRGVRMDKRERERILGYGEDGI